MLKILTIGNSGVGKTCLILRFTVLDTQDNAFTNRFISTIGVECVTSRQKSKTVNVGGKTVRVQLWDTAGQERNTHLGFRRMTSNYYRGSQAVAIVYDITDRVSFQHVNSWIQEIDKYSPPSNTSAAVVKVLIGNKCDLADRRTVSEEEGRALARANKIEFFETSAKDGKQVADTFESIVAATLAVAPEHTQVEPPKRSFALSHSENAAPEQPASSGLRCCR